MKNGFCLLLLVLNQLFGYCNLYAQTQNNTSSFRLSGTINADTGTVVLLPIGGKEFDPNIKNNYETRIKKGTFTFDGQMKYPSSYLIRVNRNYVSSDFMIEPGSQTIVCNVDSLREVPQLSNKSMEEHRLYIDKYIGPIAKEREQAFDQYLQQKSTTPDKRIQDSLQDAYSIQRAQLIRKQQTSSLDYARQHPNSYVALWQVVKEMGDGYWPVFDSIYVALSPSLKNTHTGKLLAQRLKSSRTTAIGQTFPTLNLIDISDKSVLIPISQKSKYTLVDFWFCHCGPCLQEFPKLREVFTAYKRKGFDIVGISIDKKSDVETWKKTVKEKELEWNQYLDLAGKLTVNELSIRAFPSNFLLDEKGTIIRKNISPGELSKFLSEKL